MDDATYEKILNSWDETASNDVDLFNSENAKAYATYLNKNYTKLTDVQLLNVYQYFASLLDPDKITFWAKIGRSDDHENHELYSRLHPLCAPLLCKIFQVTYGVKGVGQIPVIPEWLLND